MKMSAQFADDTETATLDQVPVPVPRFAQLSGARHVRGSGGSRGQVVSPSPTNPST